MHAPSPPSPFIAAAVLLAGCGSRSDAESAATGAGGGIGWRQSAGADHRRAGRRAAKPFVATPVAQVRRALGDDLPARRRMLVTEKAGHILLLSADGKTAPAGRRRPAFRLGRPGRADGRRPAPDFATNAVYFSYSAAGAGGKGVVLARGALRRHGAGPSGSREIADAVPRRALRGGQRPLSGRIAFSPDGHICSSPTASGRSSPRRRIEGDARQGAAPVTRRHARTGQPARRAGLPSGDLELRPPQPARDRVRRQGNLWEQEMGPQGATKST